MDQIILDIFTTGVKGLLALVALGYGAAMFYQALARSLQRVGSQRDYYGLIDQAGKPLPPVVFCKRRRLTDKEAAMHRCSPLYIKAGR